MNLFNEYENKNIYFLLNYLNRVSNGDNAPMTADAIAEFLLGESQDLTSPEIVDLILNREPELRHQLRLLSKDKENAMQISDLLHDEIDPVNLPIYPTFADRSWLYFILTDPKARLFFHSPVAYEELLAELEEEFSPLRPEIIDMRRLSSTQEYPEEYCSNFREIVFRIRKHQYMCIDDTDYLPLRLVYHDDDDSFSLLAFNVSSNDLSELWLSQITHIENSTYINFEKAHPEDSPEAFESALFEKHKASMPIQVEVIRTRISSFGKPEPSDALDRFSHLFANYDTIAYENETSNLIAEITYYDFQYNDLLRRLLMLGRYVRVIGPDAVRDNIIEILRGKPLS